MPVLSRIACLQNRRDEVPNQELARELAAAENTDGVKEIAENLFNRDKNIQGDCTNTLYEYVLSNIIRVFHQRSSINS